MITTALPLERHVAGVPQLSHDALNSPLGNPYLRGKVTHPDVRILYNADQDMGVIGKKGPRLPLMPHERTFKSGFTLRDSWLQIRG